jgi:phenylacetyl-CoA:acceptor oxidoreductase subunit 2
VSYGPSPWQQTQWDWRAAGNFMCGGAGAGLVIFTAWAGIGRPSLSMLVGLALIGLGLLCVWLEIGRPLRALHVFFNPRTSWMTREAFAAALLFPVGLVAASGQVGFWPVAALAAVLALVFVYCQGRILRGAKGIPAWREALIVPLLVATALAEGGGLWMLLHPLQAQAQPWLLGGVAMALILRAWLWTLYRRRVKLAPRARDVLDKAGNWWLAGSFVPLAALLWVVSGSIHGTPAALLLALAGALALAAGAWFKFVLITRAGFNQGFALTHLPVRGVPR